MKIRSRVLLTVLIISIITISCSTKSTEPNEDYSTGIETIHYSSEDLLTSYKDSIEAETVTELPSPLEKETEGLRYVLEPYLDIYSTLFVGEENKEFLEANLLNNQTPYLPVTAENWEQILQVLFSFCDKGKQALETYINDFAKDNKIERQYAVFTLMKLLPLRYPLSLDEADNNLQKSEVISDLNDIDGEYQDLVRQAFCLGFTDFSVDKNRLFRPFDLLNSAEAVSMLYRILSNLGLPVSEQDKKPDNEQIPADGEENLSGVTSNDFSVECMLLEYNEYKSALENSNKSSNKKRLEMLKSAEDIFGMNFNEFHAVDKPLDIEEWAQILNQVFGLESTDIDPCLDFETDGTIPYDIIAISVMNSSKKLLGYEPGEAAEKELEEARAAIPQFDTARDTGKFTQMFSSGLLEGLYFIPGFTPQRPVSEIEALLLVKRITERFKIK